MKKILISLSFLLMIFGSCGGPKELRSIQIPDDFSLYIERTLCFGACPQFQIVVKASGEVSYHGDRFVDLVGDFEKKIPKTKVKRLVQLIKNANFWQLRDKYDAQVSDVPSVITQVTMDGKTKRVLNRYAPPDELVLLQKRLEEVIGKEDYKPISN